MGSRSNRRRLEKRRRTRRYRQSGGAVASLDEWVRAIKSTPAFKKTEEGYAHDPNQSDEKLRLGNWRLESLRQDALALPEITEENRAAFSIDTYAGIAPAAGTALPADLREEGAASAIILKNVISANPTPADFKKYIEQLKVSDIGEQEDIKHSLAFLLELENKIRRDAPITTLEDGAAYPLFIWALVMNLPAEIEPALTLVYRS